MPDRFWVDLVTMMYYNWDWGKKEIPRISRWEAYAQFLPEQKISKPIGGDPESASDEELGLGALNRLAKNAGAQSKVARLKECRPRNMSPIHETSVATAARRWQRFLAFKGEAKLQGEAPTRELLIEFLHSFVEETSRS